jgi:hypothetical protein
VGVGGDPGSGAGDLRVAGEFDVVHRVVADLAALGEDLPHRLFATRHRLADLEEGRAHVLLRQHADEVVGVVARPVVEGEGDDLALARAVGDEPGAAAAAADGADGAEAEAVGAAGGEGARAAPAHLAAIALQDSPLVAARIEPGVGGLEGDHELGGVRALDPGRQAFFLLPRPLAIDDDQTDPLVWLGAAEAEPPLALAPGAAETEAEVAGPGASRVGPRLQLRQRHRLRGPHREDQLPTGLEQFGVLEPLPPPPNCINFYFCWV